MIVDFKLRRRRRKIKKLIKEKYYVSHILHEQLHVHADKHTLIMKTMMMEHDADDGYTGTCAMIITMNVTVVVIRYIVRVHRI